MRRFYLRLMRYIPEMWIIVLVVLMIQEPALGKRCTAGDYVLFVAELLLTWHVRDIVRDLEKS